MSNPLYILKKRGDIATAKQEAEAEYTAFSQQFPHLATKVETAELREIYAAEGKVAYLMRVYVEADEHTIHAIREWAQEHIVCDVPVTWDALNVPLSHLRNP